MKYLSTIFIISIFHTVIISLLISSCNNNNDINQEQAVRVAEQFVIDNGYTNLPANRGKLSYELDDEFEGNVDNLLGLRFNTLHPKAYCISEDADKWDVGFLSSSVDLSKISTSQPALDFDGRAVIVTKDGKEIRMAHKDPIFFQIQKAVKKTLPI